MNRTGKKARVEYRPIICTCQSGEVVAGCQLNKCEVVPSGEVVSHNIMFSLSTNIAISFYLQAYHLFNFADRATFKETFAIF